ARGAKHHGAAGIEYRRADDAACGLSDQPGDPQTDRGGEWLDQGGWRHGANQAARGEIGRVDVCVQGGGLQPGPIAAAAGDSMSLPKIWPRPHQRLWTARKMAENARGNRKSKLN